MAHVPDSVSRLTIAHLDAHFGAAPAARASVTFLGLQPIEILGYPIDGTVEYVSVGCAEHPMADPSQILADPERGPRAEVMMSVRVVGAEPVGLHRSLAVLAAAPAVEGVVLAEDAIMDLGQPLWQGSRFTAALLEQAPVTDLPLAPPRDPVRFLRAVPITATEAAWVRVRGAGALRQAWAEAGIDTADPTRGPVSL